MELTASGLAYKGHDVFVISTKPYFRVEKTFNDSMKVYRIKSFYHDLDRIPLILKLLWHVGEMIDILSYYKLKKILAAEKPDVVITHNLKGLGSLMPVLLKKMGIKHAHVLHDIQLLHPSGLMCLGKEEILNTLPAKTYQAINRKLFSFTDIVISPSKWLMAEHEKRDFFKKTRKIILPNPVKIQEYRKIPQKANSAFTFLYVGHLSKAKGVHLLLEIFQQINISDKDCRSRLVLFGKNMLDEKYKQFLSQPGIEYFGFNTDKLEEYYRLCDCLIMPSVCYENSPTVIYEAASWGLPVISSAIGGAAELTENLGGILFKAGDGEDLSVKMKEAIKKPADMENISRIELKNIQNYRSDCFIEKLLEIVSS